MAKREQLFAKETDLCAAFLSALPETWTPYAETAGWDILLVRKADGFQIGVQAKLKFNLDVVCQALESHSGYWSASEGPDCRAVLVPFGEGRLGVVAHYIGLTAISVSRRYTWSNRTFENVPAAGFTFQPKLPTGQHEHDDRDWHDWCTLKRCRLPDYVPDVVAGAAAPLQLTDWKVRALKIAITLELRGYVTREDFKHIEIDHRRWTHTMGWLEPRDGKWVRAETFPDFKAMHPKFYAEIAADAAKWMREAPAFLTASKGDQAVKFMLLVGTESRECEDKAEAFALGTKAAADNPRKAVSIHGDGKVWRYVGPKKGDKVGSDRSAWKCEAP